MVLLSFGGEPTAKEVSEIAALSGRTIRSVRTVTFAPDPRMPLAPQVRNAVDEVGFSSKDWQTTSIAIRLPDDSVAASVLVSEIAGRRGRAPQIVRYADIHGNGKSEPAEIISLHEIRKNARQVGKGWIPPASEA